MQPRGNRECLFVSREGMVNIVASTTQLDEAIEKRMTGIQNECSFHRVLLWRGIAPSFAFHNNAKNRFQSNARCQGESREHFFLSHKNKRQKSNEDLNGERK